MTGFWGVDLIFHFHVLFPNFFVLSLHLESVWNMVPILPETMDLNNSASPSTIDLADVQGEDDTSVSVIMDLETVCWGCDLRVLVSSSAPVFKCGWCGAITKQNSLKNDVKRTQWRWLRDRCFISIVILIMIFFIFAGIWAVYPVIFSISFSFGVFHLTLAAVLAISTLISFSLAAFQPAGSPPIVVWGSYPAVEKGGLENHTFCHYCSKPKSPRTHHCRACGSCILDMDHHCPFIGNCVGAANHRSFILFLISTVFSTVYIAIMASFAIYHIWPPLDRRPDSNLTGLADAKWIFRVLGDRFLTFFRSAVFLPMRGLVLVYLFMCSVSVGSGLSVLLWQQLCYVYSGKTYLSHLSTVDHEEKIGRDCQNLLRFFGCPHSAKTHLPSFLRARKSHKK